MSTASDFAGRPEKSAARKTIHVLHLSKHCRRGNGNVHVAVDLACVQARAGYQVTFASEGGTFVELLEEHGVAHVPLSQEQRRPFAMLQSVFHLAQLCRLTKPDVIHAHMMGGAAIGYLVARMIGIPLVTTVHNSFDFHSILMRLGDQVVAVSEAEKNHLIKVRGFREERVTAVWNAPANSPREFFMTNPIRIELKSPCVIAVCGLHQRKGVADLIEAFSLVSQRAANWTLYIVGDGPDRQVLEALTSIKGLSNRITFLGFIPAPRSLLEQSDIFVLASYADPGSLSIGEARSAGCAIVATAVGGTPEMLDHGGAGQLVMPSTPKHLAVELLKLIDHPERLSEMREAALKGSEIFDVQRLVKDYERVYAKVLGRGM